MSMIIVGFVVVGMKLSLSTVQDTVMPPTLQKLNKVPTPNHKMHNYPKCISISTVINLKQTCYSQSATRRVTGTWERAEMTT